MMLIKILGMPKGPEVVFRGKCVTWFCCNSENGSITGQLLKEMLAAIDQLNVFDRSATGLNPFLLLDSHVSHFELDFLQYINSVETKMGIIIVVKNLILRW
jgi:hypothetical protein